MLQNLTTESAAQGEDQLNFRAMSASMDRLDLEINPPTDRWVSGNRGSNYSGDVAEFPG